MEGMSCLYVLERVDGEATKPHHLMPLGPTELSWFFLRRKVDEILFLRREPKSCTSCFVELCRVSERRAP